MIGPKLLGEVSLLIEHRNNGVARRTLEVVLATASSPGRV